MSLTPSSTYLPWRFAITCLPYLFFWEILYLFHGWIVSGSVPRSGLIMWLISVPSLWPRLLLSLPLWSWENCPVEVFEIRPLDPLPCICSTLLACQALQMVLGTGLLDLALPNSGYLHSERKVYNLASWNHQDGTHSCIRVACFITSDP